MKKTSIALVLLALLSLAAACSRKEAGSQPAGGQQAGVDDTVLETAVFSVPDITDEGVRKLTAALADLPGVVSAKADRKSAALMVTFKPAAAGPKEILSALTAIDPQVTLQNVGDARDDAAPAGHDCGGCPMRNQCGKADH